MNRKGGGRESRRGLDLQFHRAGGAFSQHDQLQITNQATLAGNLNVALTSGYTPLSTDTFPLVNYTSRTGAFDHLTGDAANWSIHYGPTSATAIVNQWDSPQDLAGDFVVGSNNALVTGNWFWDGLLIKDGPGDLTLDLGPNASTSNASLAILSGAVHLSGHGALVLSGLTFGDLGALTNDPALNGQFGFFANVIPEPHQLALPAILLAITLARRRRHC